MTRVDDSWLCTAIFGALSHYTERDELGAATMGDIYSSSASSSWSYETLKNLAC